MAQLFVDNGYRTASNGTAWSAFSFVADYFDFDEYYTTSNFDTMLSYLSQKNSNGSSKYYVVASVGSGLFTTGGHYIVLVADNDNTITVYDPYLYNGKFDTASRRGAGVIVSGNSAYVTETAFRQYANYRNFWIFSNDEGEGNSNISSSTSNSVNYTRYVATQSLNLNVRSGPGTNYSIVGKLSKGTAITVSQVNGNWSYIISPVSGWVSNSYLSSSSVINNTTGQTRKTKACYLYSKSNLTGTRYTYKANTTVTILENVSNNIDKVMVTELSRLGRDTLQVLEVIEMLNARGISLYIENYHIETLTVERKVNPMSQFLITILAEVARMERKTIKERMDSGYQNYRASGGNVGRKQGYRKPDETMKTEYAEEIRLLKKGYSLRNVAKLTNTSINTLRNLYINFVKI